MGNGFERIYAAGQIINYKRTYLTDKDKIWRDGSDVKMEMSCKSSPQRLIRLMLLRSPAPKVLEPLALDKTVVVVNLVIPVKKAIEFPF